MSELLLSIIQYLLNFIAIVWILAAIANKGERNELKGRVSAVVTAPTVYEEIAEHKIDFLYPRKTLENVAKSWKESVMDPIQSWISRVSMGTENLKKDLLPEDSSSWKVFNYFFLLFLFCGFLYTDAIYVANTLEYMEIVKEIDPLLRNYAIAVTFGSLISIVIGGLIAKDVFGEGDFSDWGLRKSGWLIFAKIFSLILLFSGLYVVASLGATRFGGLVPSLPSNLLTFLKNNGVFVANVLTATNAAIATALIADDSVEKGAKVIVLFVLALMIAILQIVAITISIIVNTVIFFVDVLFRLLLVIKDIAVFIAFTPLDEAVIAFNSIRKTRS